MPKKSNFDFRIFLGQLWSTKLNIMENVKFDGIWSSWEIKDKKKFGFWSFLKNWKKIKCQNTWSFTQLSRAVTSSSSIQFEQTRAQIQVYIWYCNMEKDSSLKAFSIFSWHRGKRGPQFGITAKTLRNFSKCFLAITSNIDGQFSPWSKTNISKCSTWKF